MDGWVGGWVDGWRDEWMDGKAGLRIAYSNNKSTTTLSLQLQSLIAQVLYEDNYALMVSIDLSNAFDALNIYLLL